MIKHLYIFRHGETDWNKQKRTQGWIDVPLNDAGIIQAKSLAASLEPVGLDVIYSSPLSRAMETSKIVAERNNAKIITAEDLKERNFGVLHGHIVRLTEDPEERNFDLSQEHIVLLAKEIKDPNFAPENGESYNNLASRANAAVLDIAKKSEHKTIGISTHGGVARSILSQFADYSGMPNAAYFRMDWDGEKLSLNELPEWLSRS